MLSNEQLDFISARLDERSEALLTLTTQLENQIAAQRSKLEAEEQKRLSSAESGEERGAIRAVMGKDRRGQLSTLRHNLVGSSEKTRGEIFSPVGEWETKMATMRVLFASPVQVLSREGLGTDERTQYQAQLAGAGPAELQSTAEFAMDTGNRALAAACLITADRGGHKYRQFDRVAFAEKIVGEETKAMQRRLDELQLKIDSMRKANQWFEKGTSSPTDKIALGMARRRLEQPEDRLGKLRRGASHA